MCFDYEILPNFLIYIADFVRVGVFVMEFEVWVLEGFVISVF